MQRNALPPAGCESAPRCRPGVRKSSASGRRFACSPPLTPSNSGPPGPRPPWADQHHMHALATHPAVTSARSATTPKRHHPRLTPPVEGRFQYRNDLRTGRIRVSTNDKISKRDILPPPDGQTLSGIGRPATATYALTCGFTCHRDPKRPVAESGGVPHVHLGHVRIGHDGSRAAMKRGIPWRVMSGNRIRNREAVSEKKVRPLAGVPADASSAMEEHDHEPRLREFRRPTGVEGDPPRTEPRMHQRPRGAQPRHRGRRRLQ